MAFAKKKKQKATPNKKKARPNRPRVSFEEAFADRIGQSPLEWLHAKVQSRSDLGSICYLYGLIAGEILHSYNCAVPTFEQLYREYQKTDKSSLLPNPPLHKSTTSGGAETKTVSDAPKREPKMDRIEYKGASYTRSGKQWVDSRNMVVCDELQHALNAAFIQTLDLDRFSTWELIRLADQCKASSSVHTAIQLYERVLLSGAAKDYAAVLPRLASCYRIQGQAQKTIELAISASNQFGSDILAPMTLTSIAAAYCDLGQWKRARRCADRAFAKWDGKPSPELRAVYERIRLNTEGKKK